MHNLLSNTETRYPIFVTFTLMNYHHRIMITQKDTNILIVTPYIKRNYTLKTVSYFNKSIFFLQGVGGQANYIY